MRRSSLSHREDDVSPLQCRRLSKPVVESLALRLIVLIPLQTDARSVYLCVCACSCVCVFVRVCALWNVYSIYMRFAGAETEPLSNPLMILSSLSPRPLFSPLFFFSTVCRGPAVPTVVWLRRYLLTHVGLWEGHGDASGEQALLERKLEGITKTERKKRKNKAEE